MSADANGFVGFLLKLNFDVFINRKKIVKNKTIKIAALISN